MAGMKFWNLTYNDPGRWAEVHAISGKPLNFWETLKSGGSGSPRGVMLTFPGGDGLLTETSNMKYCNAQRMRSGVVLYFKVRLEVYGIPLQRGSVLRIETSRRQAESFPAQLRIVMRNHSCIDLACSENNAAVWLRFLNAALL